jgi:BT1 family
MTAASPAEGLQARRLRDKLKVALVTPIRAMRLRYLPLLMIYYAYGALGLVGIAEDFWIKEALTFTPAALPAIAVWLTLPWTIKMVFGQLADSVPILGSQRRAYVFIGASLVASGMVLLASAAGGWINFASKNALYVTAQLLIVIGVVLQDVITDAMTTEVVDRERPDGTPKPKAEIDRELGLVWGAWRYGPASCRWPGSPAGSRRFTAMRPCSCLDSRCRPSLSPAPCWSGSTASR